MVADWVSTPANPERLPRGPVHSICPPPTKGEGKAGTLCEAVRAGCRRGCRFGRSGDGNCEIGCTCVARSITSHRLALSIGILTDRGRRVGTVPDTEGTGRTFHTPTPLNTFIIRRRKRYRNGGTRDHSQGIRAEGQNRRRCVYVLAEGSRRQTDSRCQRETGRHNVADNWFHRYFLSQ